MYSKRAAVKPIMTAENMNYVKRILALHRLLFPFL